MSLTAGLRLATGTLTVIPVGDIGAPDRRVGRAAMLLAPVAALPLGLIAAAIVAAGRAIGLAPFVTAGLTLGALALATRAMHLDALADTADGIGAGWDRDRALEVMHRGDVGPMGAAALVITLLTQAGAIAALAQAERGWLLVAAAVICSRTACALMCATIVPAARQSGMGAVMAASVPVGLVVLALGATTAALVIAALVAGVAWWVGLLASAVAWLTVALVTRTAIRVFGGVTGDVLGAGIEIAATILLIVYSTGAIA
ncbi:adenosylcobinamide-GDP ribazoletransferase [Janibacter sp. GXQ6167]|uniref:adenosylcobinamide-GDP ribazoletransferase n=1 Tax=Janibacter sp. GXQ6167 TaxID=3240791 RepID=UPI003524633E